MDNLTEVFRRQCEKLFGFVVDQYGFKVADRRDDPGLTSVVYKSKATAVKIEFERTQEFISVYFVRLIESRKPTYPEDPAHQFLLDSLILIRRPSLRVDLRAFPRPYTPETMEGILTQYAHALRECADDVLRGDSSVFRELEEWRRRLGAMYRAEAAAVQEELGWPNPPAYTSLLRHTRRPAALMPAMAHFEFVDQNSSHRAYVIVRAIIGAFALHFFVEGIGDIEIDAVAPQRPLQRLVDALQQANAAAGNPDSPVLVHADRGQDAPVVRHVGSVEFSLRHTNDVAVVAVSARATDKWISLDLQLGVDRRLLVTMRRSDAERLLEGLQQAQTVIRVPAQRRSVS